AMTVVGVPPSVPVFCLVVPTLVVALPNKALNGVGVVPPVIVPADVIVSVAAAVVPPVMPEIYSFLPLPLGFATCSSRELPLPTATLPLVSMKRKPLLAASSSGVPLMPGEV